MAFYNHRKLGLNVHKLQTLVLIKRLRQVLQ